MGLSWSDAAIAQLEGGAIRPGIFARLAAATGPVRMWGGVGDFAYGGDGDLVEPDPAPYYGFGTLQGLPAVQGLINGVAERVEFKMSGAWVTNEISSLATWEAAAIRSGVFNLGVMILDDTWQPVSPMLWLWAGTADSLTVDRSGERGQLIRGVSLSVGSVMTGRRRPTPETWTQANIQASDPTDTFGMYVANYNAGTTRVWPNF